MRISDWSSDVCSSDLILVQLVAHIGAHDHAIIARRSARERRRQAERISAIGIEDAAEILAAEQLVAHIPCRVARQVKRVGPAARSYDVARSEEHTSELQSLMRISYAVFCLKKKTTTEHINTRYT